jgi:hypothetical protein
MRHFALPASFKQIQIACAIPKRLDLIAELDLSRIKTAAHTELVAD